MNEDIKGQFIWHELITTDMTSAAEFYGKVAGLTTQSAPSDASYTMLVASGQPAGGLLSTATMGGSPRWLSFVVSANTDETVKQAESLGSRVVQGPLDLPSGGRAAILEDPQGAVFAVWSSNTPPRLPSDVPLGGMSWHELATTDRAAAFSFYRALFGWSETSSMDMGPQGLYQMFGPAGSQAPFGGMYTKGPEAPGGPNWLPYIKVTDARPATNVARAQGATILNGPMQVPGGGWISMGIDPQGALFAIHSAAPAAAAPEPAATRRSAKKAKSTAAKKQAAKAKRVKAGARTRDAAQKTGRAAGRKAMSAGTRPLKRKSAAKRTSAAKTVAKKKTAKAATAKAARPRTTRAKKAAPRRVKRQARRRR